jgi:hypothetical protein
VDPTRRRFLTVAAVGSMAGAGTLAAAAFTPNDVPQAVTLPSGSSSPALRAAIGRLDEAHTELERAMEADYAANELFEAWERSQWHALMAAEQAFADAQIAVAAIPIASVADLHAMAACSTIYDEVELNRHNRAPIARVVAQELCRHGKAVLS